MNRKERQYRKIIIALSALCLILFIICLCIRPKKQPEPNADPYIKAIHARDSVIIELAAEKQAYRDTLELSRKTQTLIKQHYDEIRHSIRDAHTNHELDSLFSASGID